MAALSEILGQVHTGTYVEPSRQLLVEYLPEWLSGLRVKPTTLDNYRTCVDVQILPDSGVSGTPISRLSNSTASTAAPSAPGNARAPAAPRA